MSWLRAKRTIAFTVTSIDPERNDLLFERFVSEERHEPPDIGVDFEHERREIVMQWVFDTYGRDHAALCSTVIRYRAKGALRDVGKALGRPRTSSRCCPRKFGDGRRHRMRGLHAKRGRPAQTEHGDLQTYRRRLKISRQAGLRHDRQWL
jgi:DNA polymerase III alpha subunit